MGRLEGKVAIITGAGAGIGREASILFAEEGAKVVVADLVAEGGEGTAEMVREVDGEAVFIKTDISKAEDVENMTKATIDMFGTLDILFNNAGILSKWESITEWTEENFDKVIAVNLKGVWLGMKYAIPEMIKSGGGSIINTASTAADVAQRGSSIYAASKGGVASLSRVAAVESAPHKIRVNCIKPGPIATAMVMDLFAGNPQAMNRIEMETPLGRFGKPGEIAQVALFLASDESSWITGQTIVVDGGIEANGHLDVTG